MNTRFDEVINRLGTNSLKWEFAVDRGQPADVLPLWVADMDFRVPPPVTEALERMVQHGIYGYSDGRDGYYDALSGWMQRRFGWKVERDWVVKTPGVVTALAVAVRALTEPGAAVLIQQPVYYPFAGVVAQNSRTLVVNELHLVDGRYELDLADFEAKIVEQDVKLFILCSPHNPVGRVWTRAELEAMGDICVKHGVTVIADEIHADLVHAGHSHRVFADLKPEFRDITITCTAPSKTFNLAGLQASNIFIADATLRSAFRAEMMRCAIGGINTAGLVACEAAYAHGDAWLAELLQYLQGNIDYVRGFLAERIPQVRLIEPEATYLLWLDFRALGLEAKELNDFISHDAHLWLNQGDMFGVGGDGFQRMNVACPRATLERALELLAAAVDALPTRS